jgi:hypothetical protein
MTPNTNHFPKIVFRDWRLVQHVARTPDIREVSSFCHSSCVRNFVYYFVTLPACAILFIIVRTDGTRQDTYHRPSSQQMYLIIA